MRWLLPLLFWPLLTAQAQVRSSVVSTTARGDSLFATIVFDSVHLKIDTVFVIRRDTVYIPSLPSTSNRVLFGASKYPLDSLGPVYQVVVTGLDPATMLADLAKIKAKGSRIIIQLARKPTQEMVNGDTVLSVAATRRYLATWPDSSRLNPYFRDGTILMVRTSDDIVSKAIWGPDAPNKPRIDSLGLVVKQRYPLAITGLRALPTQMGGYQWKWTDYAWAQYAKLDRMGTPEQFKVAQCTAARNLVLGVIFGFNATGYAESTPAEIEQYAKVLGPATPWFTYWWYETVYSERPEIKAAFAKARAILDTTAYRGCR